ncbi:ZN574 protein, partial [Calcarius ornatus]|nr:ZN574 protein [Calcarius ornatus]
LFQSQDLWLAHRQNHRNPTNSPQTTARVDLEHSYRKQNAESAEICAEIAAEPPVNADSIQLLLYECGECLQLFQSPKDFLEHQ